MARGATKTAEQTAQQIGQTAQQTGQTAQTEANQSYAALMPQISQMLSPGGDPAVTAATLGSVGSSFGNAKQGIMDTAARTNNAASTNAALDKTALNEGSTLAQTAANNVMQQHGAADSLLAKIFGQTSQNANEALGQRTNANNSYINGIKTGGGVLKTILGGLSGGLVGAAGAEKAGAGAGA